MTDPYLQPNGTLKNKLGLSDPAKLDRAEADLTGQRLAFVGRSGPNGPYTYERLKATHHYVFQDVYGWAGEPRVTELYKPAELGQRPHRFTAVEELEGEARRIFARLERNNEFKGLDRETFAKRAATLFADLNQLHPFREGNGRTQRAFVSALAREADHELAFDVVSRERMIEASVRAARSQPDMMRRMFNEISNPERVRPLREAIAFLSEQKFNWNERYLATTEPGRLYKGTFVGQNGQDFRMHDGAKIIVGRTSDLNGTPGSGESVQFRTQSLGLKRNRGLER